jgi:hypothetical protein
VQASEKRRIPNLCKYANMAQKELENARGTLATQTQREQRASLDFAGAHRELYSNEQDVNNILNSVTKSTTVRRDYRAAGMFTSKGAP